MSRSHRYNPITSFVKVASEKKDKQRWHRAWRARQRAVLNAAVRITESEDVEEAFAGFNLILPREVSDVWAMEKDGKVRSRRSSTDTKNGGRKLCGSERF